MADMDKVQSYHYRSTSYIDLRGHPHEQIFETIDHLSNLGATKKKKEKKKELEKRKKSRSSNATKVLHSPSRDSVRFLGDHGPLFTLLRRRSPILQHLAPLPLGMLLRSLQPERSKAVDHSSQDRDHK